MNRRLSRSSNPGTALRPVRIAHIGLGAFHRTHQAWYTQHADPDWGIAAFTGRDPRAAQTLEAQDGLYTLLERGPHGDQIEIVSSISAAESGANVAKLVDVLAAPATSIVTLTITEKGYRLDHDNSPDQADALVQADLVWMEGAATRADLFGIDAPRTVMGRLAAGLEARRRVGGDPITIVPCDNLPGNGALVKAALLFFAERAPELHAYIESAVSFASTSVDRITPRTTGHDLDAAEALSGYRDEAVVVAEPFSNWVIQGDFPAGRPSWHDVGAQFVEDVEPYERRKLWLLNGAHTILASCGSLRGHATVAQAMTDDVVVEAVNDYWDAAAEHLGRALDVPGYRLALERRFRNPRIEHRLDQIAQDAPTKIRARLLPILERERRAGRDGAAVYSAIAAWMLLQSPDRSRNPDDVRAILARVAPSLTEAHHTDRVREAASRLWASQPTN